MYTITKSIDIDFAHHVDGHPGACINIHGHTWKFEVDLSAEVLDPHGFVCDFKDVKTTVLQPIHDMLDHGLLLSDDTFSKCVDEMERLGNVLVSTRNPNEQSTNKFHFCVPLSSYKDRFFTPVNNLNGMYDVDCGGIKVIVCDFAPTSERLADWLANAVYTLMSAKLHRVRKITGRVYETLHPVNSVAQYSIDVPF